MLEYVTYNDPKSPMSSRQGGQGGTPGGMSTPQSSPYSNSSPSTNSISEMPFDRLDHDASPSKNALNRISHELMRSVRNLCIS